MSHLPTITWREIEGGKVEALCPQSLKMFLNRDVRTNMVERLKEGFEKFKKRDNMYAVAFINLEIVTLIFITFQSYAWTKVLGHGFTMYGFTFIGYYMVDQEIDQLPLPKSNPAYEYFPHMAKCQMNTMGVGGDIEVNVL